MWIGDFVRCHSVVRLLNARFPGRPVDVLTTTMDAPLLDYMPGVRKGIVCDLPRKRLALSAPSSARRPPAPGALWRRPDHAPDLEGGARPGPGGHPGPHRFHRRNAVRPDQRPAPGRKGAAAHGRPLCRPGIAERRRAAGRVAASAARCAGRGGVGMAPADGTDRWAAGGGGGAGRGRPIETMAGGGLCRARKADRRTGVLVVGDRRSPGEGAGRARSAPASRPAAAT